MGGSVVHYRKIFVRISAKQSEIRTQSVPDLADHIGESENFSVCFCSLREDIDRSHTRKFMAHLKLFAEPVLRHYGGTVRAESYFRSLTLRLSDGIGTMCEHWVMSGLPDGFGLRRSEEHTLSLIHI